MKSMNKSWKSIVATMAVASVFSIAPIHVSAWAPNGGWQQGDLNTHATETGRKNRSKIIFAEELTTSGSEPGAPGGITESSYTDRTGIEACLIDKTAGNDRNIISGLFDAILRSSSRKTGTLIGITGRAILNQSDDLINSDSESSARISAAYGGVFYSGFCSPEESTYGDLVFHSGLLNTLTGTLSYVEMDAVSTNDTDIPVISGDTKGLDVTILNGTRTAGDYAVIAGNVVGVDVGMLSSDSDSDDTAQMDSYYGVRVNAPLKFNHSTSELDPNLEDFSGTSAGVFVAGALGESDAGEPYYGVLVDEAPAKSGPTDTRDFVGIRSESTVELAGSVVLDPKDTTTLPSTASSCDKCLPINRAVVLFDLAAPNSTTHYNAYSPLDDGEDGQVITLINVGTGTGSAVFYESVSPGTANLNLGSSTRTLAKGDALTLVYSAALSQWIEISFSNN